MEHEVVHHIGPGIRELYALINVLVVAAIIYFAGRKGISASLKERSASISKRLIEAKIELEKMQKESEKLRRQVDNLHVEKRRIVDSVSEEGRRMALAMAAEARETADRILADAKLGAENEMRMATNNLREKLVKAALSQSVLLVKSGGESNDMKNQIHAKLFEKLISDLPETFEVSNGV